MIVDCPSCSLRHVVIDRAAGTTLVCDCGHEFARRPHAFADGVVKCANCGGNPPPDATRCPYCDAHLARTRCARCLAHGVEGDLHCRACGHSVEAPAPTLARGPDEVLDCPRCDRPLRAVMVGDALLDECTSCSGLWITQATLRDILSRTDQDKMFVALKSLRSERRFKASGRPETDQRFYIRCPECDAQLQRRQFARISGVVVDVCLEHGVWFDRDELAAIVAFVREGGLQRAEQSALQDAAQSARKAARKRASIDYSTAGDYSAARVVFEILNAMF